jgi:accessory colonization factor AcfC
VSVLVRSRSEPMRIVKFTLVFERGCYENSSSRNAACLYIGRFCFCSDADSAEFERTSGNASSRVWSRADARQNGGVIFSGSEEMMSDFAAAMQGALDSTTITPLYMRKAAILVRPGNPMHIHSLEDLMKPPHHILVVNGAGQRGLWEDVAGRKGDIESVIRFRKNIAVFAARLKTTG